MISVSLKSVGLNASGLENWESAQTVLQGTEPYDSENYSQPKIHLLPANEQRRISPLVKHSLLVANEAVGDIDYIDGNLSTVFASSEGDVKITCEICEMLTKPGYPISPTKFHNSVHNTPAGYWSIATRSLTASISISAYDGTFAAGLLEAATQAVTNNRPVLLVCYDHPLPGSLSRYRAICEPFAVAMVVEGAREDVSQSNKLGLQIGQADETRLQNAKLESLRIGNPAARCLPLLRALVMQQNTVIVLPYVGQQSLAINLFNATDG